MKRTKRRLKKRWIFIYVLLCMMFPSILIPLSFCVLIVYLAWLIYQFCYYHSAKFKALKSQIEMYTADCNALNEHIADLERVHLGDSRLDAGVSNYHDASTWHFKRRELSKIQNLPNVHNCSRTVCDGARKEPFRYVCKYFNIQPTEESLSDFESLLNNFEAAEEGKRNALAQKESIIASISGSIPFLIRKFSHQLDSKLGFAPIDIGDTHYPKYVFQYTSSGGNASTRCDITMDIDNLNRFVEYLSYKIKFRKSAAGQRALMTSKLRQTIKERDSYTCRLCGASVAQEPHLLLEVDHIVPVSKGGLTTEDNLQTLCWRCNRSKGAKM